MPPDHLHTSRTSPSLGQRGCARVASCSPTPLQVHEDLRSTLKRPCGARHGAQGKGRTPATPGLPAQLRMAPLNMLVAALPTQHTCLSPLCLNQPQPLGNFSLVGTTEGAAVRHGGPGSSHLSVQGPGRWCKHPAHRLRQPSGRAGCQPFSSWAQLW